MNNKPLNASRPPPPKVAAIVYQGIRYEQSFERMGYLLAIDQQTGQQLWRLKVYSVPESGLANLPTPAIYFTQMERIEGEPKLRIKNEAGESFCVDLLKRTLIDDCADE